MSAHTAQTKLKLVGKLILAGEIHCETGLHIGAGKVSLEIGGALNPVVEGGLGMPYLPVQSLPNPRTGERVRAGARFKVGMVLDVLCDEDKALAARLFEGLRLLEDDALGGGGSRGSGRVGFANLKLTWRGRGFYSSGAEEV